MKLALALGVLIGTTYSLKLGSRTGFKTELAFQPPIGQKAKDYFKGLSRKPLFHYSKFDGVLNGSNDVDAIEGKINPKFSHLFVSNENQEHHS
eukprot:Awhi_evm1s13350